MPPRARQNELSGRTVLIVLLVLLVCFGGAAVWLQHLHSAPKVSEFDCLSTAHTGWLTISAGQVTVHSDWESGAGRIDGRQEGSRQQPRPDRVCRRCN